MRNFLISAICLIALTACVQKSVEGPKISIFCQHIETIASQEAVDFTTAAGIVKDLGYSGVEINVGTEAEKIAILDSLGFKRPCAIATIDYCAGEQAEAEQEVLDYLKTYNFDKLLLIPGFLTDENPCACEAVKRVAAFAAKAAGMGIKVVVEDFDNEKSPCYGTAALEKMFEASPELGMCFDTGNFLEAGEDCWRAVWDFSDMIAHVHLKDRVSESDLSCPASGTGCLPIVAIVKKLAAQGYDGWYAVEHFGSRHMLADAAASYAAVSCAIANPGMTPGMTEYYFPAVAKVTPAPYVETAAPEGATILFDGSNLDAWTSSNGEAAGWTLNGDGTMTVDKTKGDIRTKDEFGSYQLHIEWCVPEDIEGSSQARGNSGVFMHGLYEVQVLDNYENETYIDGMAASLYKQSVPAANPCRKPGEWNVYDITFTAAVPATDSEPAVRPRITVVFNGVTVQDNFELRGTTEYIGLPREIWSEKGPISLQMHGDPSKPISFKNIWIKEI